MKCKYCGRTDFKNAQGLSIHERLHCQKREDTPAGMMLECEGGCSWRFLNSKDPTEKIALDRGYTKICEECEEIL
jgi:hypothetical protein